MYAFNAVQIVILYACLPWLIQQAIDRECDSLFIYAMRAVQAIGTLFLVGATTNQLYSIDKEVRNL